MLNISKSDQAGKIFKELTTKGFVEGKNRFPIMTAKKPINAKS